MLYGQSGNIRLAFFRLAAVPALIGTLPNTRLQTIDHALMTTASHGRGVSSLSVRNISCSLSGMI